MKNRKDANKMGLVAERKTQTKSYSYGYEVKPDAKIASTVEALRDIWKVIKPGHRLILHGIDRYPSREDDMYWQGLWREIKGFADIKLVNYFTYLENKKPYWMVIAQRMKSQEVVTCGEQNPVVIKVVPDES